MYIVCIYSYFRYGTGFLLDLYIEILDTADY